MQETIEAFNKREAAHSASTATAFTEALARYREAARMFRRNHPRSALPYVLTVDLYRMLNWDRRARQVFAVADKRFPYSRALEMMSLMLDRDRSQERRTQEFLDLVKQGLLDVDVAVDVDGRTVTGKIIFVSATDIDVEITSPVKGIKEYAPHVPWFAAGYPQNQYLTDGKLTEKGQRVAAETLAEIYRSITGQHEQSQDT